MMLWPIGVLLVLIYRAIYAGMHYEILCDKPSDYEIQFKGKKADELENNPDKIVGYICISLAIAFSWFLVIPAYGLYRLGRKIGKKKIEHSKET